MEARYVNVCNTLYFYSGAITANYSAKFMIEVIESTSEWQEYLITKSVETLKAALTAAFLNIDLRMISEGHLFPMQQCGCTSVLTLITPTHIVCANAGDSRCVLGFKKNQTKNMSEDHKPQSEIESNRVKAAGGELHTFSILSCANSCFVAVLGFIAIGRVDGDLAVSRALGDFNFKSRSDLSQQEQKVRSIFRLLYLDDHHLFAIIEL
jgi:serine/threonine protein phosphatase PrpC